MVGDGLLLGFAIIKPAKGVGGDSGKSCEVSGMGVSMIAYGLDVAETKEEVEQEEDDSSNLASKVP